MNVFVQVSCCRHAPTGSERVEDSCLSRAALRAQHGTNWALNSSRVAKKKNVKKVWNKMRRIYVTKPVDKIFL